MALNGLFCAYVPLRNYSRTHALTRNKGQTVLRYDTITIHNAALNSQPDRRLSVSIQYTAQWNYSLVKNIQFENSETRTGNSLRPQYGASHYAEPKIIENSYCTPSPLSPSLFSLPLSFLFLPLSLFFLTVFPSFPFLFLPLPPFRNTSLQIQLGGLRERCKLGQRGLGPSPSRNRIWCSLALKYDSWWQQF